MQGLGVPPAVSGAPGRTLCCLGGELKLLLPQCVRRHDPVSLDQPGRIVAIAERSLCACCALYHKPPDTVGEVAWAATTSNYRLRQPTFTEKKLLFRGR